MSFDSNEETFRIQKGTSPIRISKKLQRERKGRERSTVDYCSRGNAKHHHLSIESDIVEQRGSFIIIYYVTGPIHIISTKEICKKNGWFLDQVYCQDNSFFSIGGWIISISIYRDRRGDWGLHPSKSSTLQWRIGGGTN